MKQGDNLGKIKQVVKLSNQAMDKVFILPI